jgi:hypothetical protein
MTGYGHLEIFVILSGAQRQSKDAGAFVKSVRYQTPLRL